jgi:hypothetical protein
MSKFLHGLVHTAAGATAFGLAAIATGWHPGTSPLVDILWATGGVSVLSGLVHALEAYSKK